MEGVLEEQKSDIETQTGTIDYGNPQDNPKAEKKDEKGIIKKAENVINDVAQSLITDTVEKIGDSYNKAGLNLFNKSLKGAIDKISPSLGKDKLNLKKIWVDNGKGGGYWTSNVANAYNQAVTQAYNNAKAGLKGYGDFDKIVKRDKDGNAIIGEDGKEETYSLSDFNYKKKWDEAEKQKKEMVIGLYDAYKDGLINKRQFASGLMQELGNLVGGVGNAVSQSVGVGQVYSNRDNTIDNVINSKLKADMERYNKTRDEAREQWMSEMNLDRNDRREFEKVLTSWKSNPELAGAFKQFDNEKGLNELKDMYFEAKKVLVDEKGNSKLGEDEVKMLMMLAPLAKQGGDFSQLVWSVMDKAKAENRTGLDYVNNLIDTFGNARQEAQDTVSLGKWLMGN